jgi:hypothetical protein
MTDKIGYPDDNPKTLSGVSKVPLNLVPPSAKHFLAEAFADGARKYGPYNWRDKNVSASIYYAAAQRHMDSWWDGEDFSEDAGVHHIAHAMACMAIILDALTVGALNDDRPTHGATPWLQKEFVENKNPQKEQDLDDLTTEAPTGFNPPDGTLVVDRWDTNGSTYHFVGREGELYSAVNTAAISGSPALHAVESSGLSNLQTDVRPVTSKPVDPNDPSAIEGSKFLYGDASGEEYWVLPDGGVVRYNHPDTTGL